MKGLGGLGCCALVTGLLFTTLMWVTHQEHLAQKWMDSVVVEFKHITIDKRTISSHKDIYVHTAHSARGWKLKPFNVTVNASASSDVNKSVVIGMALFPETYTSQKKSDTNFSALFAMPVNKSEFAEMKKNLRSGRLSLRLRGEPRIKLAYIFETTLKFDRMVNCTEVHSNETAVSMRCGSRISAAKLTPEANNTNRTTFVETGHSDDNVMQYSVDSAGKIVRVSHHPAHESVRKLTHKNHNLAPGKD